MPKISWKAARVNAKMTIAQSAKAAGVSPSTIKNWEAGKSFPKQPEIELLCEVYGIPFDYIDCNPKG